jgi:hypothetical protein
MIVTDMPVERLVPYARNPRNNTAAIDAVKASIAEFGFRQPIVVDEKLVVIVGHTRLEAAKAAGAQDGAGACGRGPHPGAGQSLPHHGQPLARECRVGR